MLSLVIVALAGFLAGAMNAAAGGGTFVSLPALIAAGVPSVAANMTSTLGLCPGTFASAYAFRKDFRTFCDAPITVLIGVSLVGGALGAVLLIVTPSRAFDQIVPWLLLFGAFAFAFGRSIGRFQVIRHKFAEMATKIETARQMVYMTAWRFNNGEYPVREISMAKLYASRIAVEVADECIQIHGGAGYMKEYGVERVWRDMRLNRIGAGTDEIMLEVIGRSYGL